MSHNRLRPFVQFGLVRPARAVWAWRDLYAYLWSAHRANSEKRAQEALDLLNIAISQAAQRVREEADKKLASYWPQLSQHSTKYGLQCRCFACEKKRYEVILRRNQNWLTSFASFPLDQSWFEMERGS